MQVTTVPFITLPNWLKAASLCGFNIHPIFKRLGIEADLLNLEQARISLSTLDELMKACVEAAWASDRGQHFPFVLGDSFTFEYLPEMETYINTSSSLRDATRVLQWVHQLISPYVDIQLEEDQRIARMVLVYTRSELPEAAALAHQPYTSESFFATLLKFNRLLMGRDAQVRLLRFRHAPPANAQDYETFFNVPVAFNQDRDCLEFDRHMLDIPLQGAYPDLHHQAEQLVQQRLSRQSRRQGLAARLHQLFANDPTLLRGTINAPADRLNMHPRSLQRHLKSEGTSFGEVQTEARLAVAVHALQRRGENLDTLSDRLGFSDRRSFTRAFKRWTGVSPSQYRKTL